MFRSANAARSTPSREFARTRTRATPIGALRSGLGLASALILCLALTACDDDPVGTSPGDPIERTFVFEEDMEGWQAVATDTLAPPIDWHVRHTTEEARTGAGSIELYLENLNDAGKIWMERGFELEPGRAYDVEIRYGFATADWGDVNLFTIIAGVHETPPRDADALTYQGETGHGEGQDAGHVWLDKSYDLSITAPANGIAHVTIGVWGTWETARTYYVDDVTVRFVPAGS